MTSNKPIIITDPYTRTMDILFSKENDAVQGSIGLGTPSSATDDNDLIINSNFTDKGIIFKTQGTERFKINPRIGVLGLNPHCETIDKFNEDEKIIKPILHKQCAVYI